VYVNSSGQLGTLTSSRRFKNDIRDIGNSSDRLMQLRPVSFRYKDSAEKGPHPLQYGLIAEEVATVYPDLVQYDKQGKPFTVYYHLLTPIMLNELQKQHHLVEAQHAASIADKAAVAALRSEVASLKLQLAAQGNQNKSEIAALESEITSMKVAQEQQSRILAKLASMVPAQQSRDPLQTSALVQR